MKTPTKGLYSQATIANALERLRLNDGNLKKTSRELNISRDALRRWAKKYPDQLPAVEDNYTEVEVVEPLQEVYEPLPEDIRNLDEAISEAIKRAKELIPNCRTAIEASTVAKNLTKVRLDLTSNNDENNKKKAQGILAATLEALRKNS